MVAKIVDNIMRQCEQHPNGREIKRLLFLKLEMELNQNRCVFEVPPETKKDGSFVEIVE